MFTKQYLKKKPVCKVTFKVFQKDVGPAETVRVIGDFNSWALNAPSMKKLKNGDFTCQMDLETDRDYQFRYLIDNKKWLNDDKADAYVPSPFPGVDNSVLKI